MNDTDPSRPDGEGPTTYQRLRPSARLLLDDRFVSGDSRPDLQKHQDPAAPECGFNATLLRRLLTKAMGRGGERTATDAWLAPRLHAVLRLPRTYAADNGLWFWLAATHARDYVRWRWPATSEGKSLKRYTGGDRDNALSRLWWTAELFRNGADYTPVVQAFRLQDITSTWLVLDAVHHQAAAQAAVSKIFGWAQSDESSLSKRANRLANVFNHHLTTVMLDAVAPTIGPDAGAVHEWLDSEPDEYEILDDELPQGPNEDVVDPEAIARVSLLLQQVADQEGIDIKS